MRAILAAIDFSNVTDLVVAQAVGLARPIGGKVVLVHVINELAYVDEFAPPQKRLAEFAAARERAARSKLAAIQQKLVRTELVPAEAIVRRGHSAMRIMEEAAEHDAAFIVMGSHGHTALFELILGSTTQAVLKGAQQPVVVIPSQMCKPRRTEAPVAAQPATA